MDPLETSLLTWGGISLIGAVLLTFLSAAQTNRWVQSLCFLLSVACVWIGLVWGTMMGYDTWQSMPEPPDEAFADGAHLTGSIMFGWFPATFLCVGIRAVILNWNARKR